MSRFRYGVIFLYIFICTGFTLGTVTLSLIVERLVDYIRKTGWLLKYENAIVLLIIGILIIYSFIIAKSLTKVFFNHRAFGKLFLWLILTGATALCVWHWSTPQSSTHLRTDEEDLIVSQDGRFIAGPYPDRDKMMYLKSHGYTAIISLLSPYVVPFEPVLMDKEKKLAKEVGIQLISLPMLPWVSKNTDSINQIKALAMQRNQNKYYVHCYYGRDRASMFIRMVDGVSPFKVTKQQNSEQTKIIPLIFERGTGYFIDNHVVFAPSPTDDELTLILNLKKHSNALGNISIQTVISIRGSGSKMSPSEESLKQYGVQFSMIPFNSPYDPMLSLSLAKQLKQTAGGVLLYTFYTDSTPMPSSLEGIMYSYLTGLPSLPYSSFKSFTMSQGKAKLIAPNVVLGPSPDDREYSIFLYIWGIREVAYIGECGEESTREKTKAENAKLLFRCFSPSDPSLIASLSQNGPWYVYGPQLKDVEQTLVNRFHNSIPEIHLEPKMLNVHMKPVGGVDG